MNKKKGDFVGVNEEFIPESEKYVDESLLGDEKETKRKVFKLAKGFGIGYLVFLGFVIVVFIGMFVFFISMMTGMLDFGKESLNQMTGAISNNTGLGESEVYEEDLDQVMLDTFNNQFEFYEGENPKMFIDNLLGNIVANNSQNTVQKVELTFEGENITEISEINDLKKTLEGERTYNVSIEYAENGYVNKVIIN